MMHSQKKKIIVLLWHPPGKYTGGSFDVIQNSFKYHQHDEEIEWVVIDRYGSHLEAFSALNLISCSIPEWINILNTKNVVLGRMCELPFSLYMSWRYSIQEIKRGNVIAIYIPIAELLLPSTLIAVLVSKIYKIRTVGLIHQLDDPNVYRNFIQHVQGLVKSGSSWFLAFILATLLRSLFRLHIYCLKSLSEIITVSQPMQQKLEKWTERKVKVLHFGFDYSHYDEVGILEKKYDAVFLGRLVQGKGLEDMMAAWKIVTDHHLNAKLLIIGTGEKTYTDKLFFKNPLIKNGSIILAGLQTGTKKVQLLLQSKTFLFLSHHESYALVIDEAVAARLPIIAYDLPCYARIKNTGYPFFVFNTGDYKGAAAKVLELLNSTPTTLSKSIPRLPSWKKYADEEKNIIIN